MFSRILNVAISQRGQQIRVEGLGGEVVSRLPQQAGPGAAEHEGLAQHVVLVPDSGHLRFTLRECFVLTDRYATFVRCSLSRASPDPGYRGSQRPRRPTTPLQVTSRRRAAARSRRRV